MNSSNEKRRQRSWKRIRKFISKPKYEYLYRQQEQEDISDDVPMIEITDSEGDINDNIPLVF